MERGDTLRRDIRFVNAGSRSKAPATDQERGDQQRGSRPARRAARFLARIGNIEATAPPCGGLPGARGISASPWLSAGHRTNVVALLGEGAFADVADGVRSLDRSAS